MEKIEVEVKVELALLSVTLPFKLYTTYYYKIRLIRFQRKR